MKKIYLILIPILLLAACTPQNYYQLLETQGQNFKADNNSIEFANDDLLITYDLWGDKGNGSFTVYNKTEKDVFIDLKRSHLIINGVAHTYFQNRSFSNKKISFFSPASEEQIIEDQSIKLPGVSPKKASVQADESVSFAEERLICIPPHSSQIVFGFNLLEDIYRDCNLFRFPTEKQIISAEFGIDKSPFKYRNRISYSHDENMSGIKTIENELYISKITNFPENEFIKYENIKFCNDSSNYSSQVYPYYKPTSFFIKYKLEPGRIDH